MDLTHDQVRAFVGPEADYYLDRWHRIRDEWGSRALGFNWAAFFLTLSWLLYRRMYRGFWIAIAVWVASFILVLLAMVLAALYKMPILVTLLGLGLGVTSLAVPVLFGIYGTYWYYLHARRQISQLTAAGQVDPATIGNMGGTNLSAAVVSAVVIGFMAIWAEHGSP